MTIHPEHSNNPAQDENLIHELETALKTAFSEYITVEEHKIKIKELQSQYQRKLQERCDALEKKFQERYDALETKLQGQYQQLQMQLQGQYQQLQQQLTEHTHPKSSNEDDINPHQSPNTVVNGDNGAARTDVLPQSIEVDANLPSDQPTGGTNTNSNQSPNTVANGDNGAARIDTPLQAIEVDAGLQNNTPAHHVNTNPHQSSDLVSSGENTTSTKTEPAYEHEAVERLYKEYSSHIKNKLDNLGNLLTNADELCKIEPNHQKGILYLTEMCCFILQKRNGKTISGVTSQTIKNFTPKIMSHSDKEPATIILTLHTKGNNRSIFYKLLINLVIASEVQNMHEKFSTDKK